MSKCVIFSVYLLVINTYANYYVGSIEVTNNSYERDLRVVIDESLQ